jgi:hypothetical protein
MSLSASSQVTQQAITELLDELPPESLVVLKQFMEFLHEQARRGQPVVAASGTEAQPYRYPTVDAPASSLKGWSNLLKEGYDGDALADSESLYDET